MGDPLHWLYIANTDCITCPVVRTQGLTNTVDKISTQFESAHANLESR